MVLPQTFLTVWLLNDLYPLGQMSGSGVANLCEPPAKSEQSFWLQLVDFFPTCSVMETLAIVRRSQHLSFFYCPSSTAWLVERQS